MASKILIDQKDFALLNAVKIYMSLDGITHDQYINTMCEHAQSSLSERFDNFDHGVETVILVSSEARQTIGGNGDLSRPPTAARVATL